MILAVKGVLRFTGIINPLVRSTAVSFALFVPTFPADKAKSKVKPKQDSLKR